jgi:hypothetical protein
MEHIFLMVFVRCPEKLHLFRKLSEMSVEDVYSLLSMTRSPICLRKMPTALLSIRSSSQTDEEVSLRSWVLILRESYTTYRLQQKLAKHFGDAIVIQCQQGQGMSNIVYSSSICLSEAIDTPTV